MHLLQKEQETQSICGLVQTQSFVLLPVNAVRTLNVATSKTKSQILENVDDCDDDDTNLREQCKSPQENPAAFPLIVTNHNPRDR